MSRRNPQRRPQSLSGVPPFTPRLDRKALQLGAQVKDALNWVLGSVSDRPDDVLVLCAVADVEPLPGGNRMVVKVAVPPDVALSRVTDQLAESASALRMEVALAITRRKVPELIYVPVQST